MRIGGHFNGTGADVYICVGFVPDFVHILNLEGTIELSLRWNKMMMGAAEVVEGFDIQTASPTALTKGNGIMPYYGGEALTAAKQTSVTYGEGIYLKRDDWDYRHYSGNVSPGDAVAVDIDTWTLDTTANYTGHFNEDVNGDYIGEGSRICIDGKWYTIVALTATQGEGDDEVTLSNTVPSGDVLAITGKSGYKPIPVGDTTPAGFLISNNTINVNDALIAFECGMYDI